MLSDNANVSLKIVDSSLFTRKILVAEPNHQYLQRNLEREPAHYNYMETIAKTFIIPSRQNQCAILPDDTAQPSRDRKKSD